MAKKTPSIDSVIEESNENESVRVKKTTRSSKTKRATSRTKKKLTDESLEDPGLLVNNEDSWSTASDDSKKKPRRTRKKDAFGSTGVEEEKKEKKVRRRKEPKKEDVIMEEKGSEAESSDQDEPSFIEIVEEETEDDLELIKDDGEDISFTYAWPPLVCCFGSAQHAFVPSGRPANRLINYEIHERMRDTLWSPENFVRAPGGSAGSVAIALASLGGKVTFMGKLANDEYGQAMLYYMNVNNVQTRSISIDSKRATVVSLMKIGKQGRLRMSCVKPCAEDCLSKSEINIDVLKAVWYLKPIEEKDFKKVKRDLCSL